MSIDVKITMNGPTIKKKSGSESKKILLEIFSRERKERERNTQNFVALFDQERRGKQSAFSAIFQILIFRFFIIYSISLSIIYCAFAFSRQTTLQLILEFSCFRSSSLLFITKRIQTYPNVSKCIQTT